MSGLRKTLVRAVATLSALLWLIPGFGLVDLTVTWDPTWPVVLEAGWGLMFTALVSVPFVALASKPQSTAALLQLTTVCLALVLGAALSLAWPAGVVSAVLAAQIAVISLITRRPPWRPVGPSHRSVPLLGVAALGTGPWIAYALSMFAADREERPDRDLTNGVDHYSVQGALAVAMLALTYLAAVWPRRLRVAAYSTGVSAFYLGLVSLCASRNTRRVRRGLVVGSDGLGSGRGCRSTS
jgi:hypothetical protein